jgi:RimJ/RimL family protein N-acetyltransferase
MKIKLANLEEKHFQLLLEWLELPYIKKYWDSDISYNMQLITDKYTSYTKGYKIENGEYKHINAKIIYIDNIAIGYVQFYNAYDFFREYILSDLPKSLACFDIFIGDKEYMGKKICQQTIDIMIKDYLQEYEYIFADTDKSNNAAIKAYRNSGFIFLREEGNNILMLKQIKI